MIEFSVSVSGGQLAHNLAADTEELAEFFGTLVEMSVRDIIQMIGDLGEEFNDRPDGGAVADLLRRIATAVGVDE